MSTSLIHSIYLSIHLFVFIYNQVYLTVMYNFKLVSFKNIYFFQLMVKLMINNWGHNNTQCNINQIGKLKSIHKQATLRNIS